MHVLPALQKGGGERVAVDLANSAARCGHEVTLITAIDPQSITPQLVPDDQIQVLNVWGSASHLRAAYFAILPWIFAHRDFLRSRDVVHCHLTFGSLFGLGVQMLRRLGGRTRPVVVETNHTVGTDTGWFRRSFLAATLAHKDRVALVAENAYWLDKARRHRGGLTVIRNGVSRPIGASNDSAGLRKIFDIPASAPLVGTIGRLHRERRPDRLLEVFRHLDKLSDGTHFVIGGDGPFRSELEAQAARSGLTGRVHFAGLVLDPASFINDLDLFLSINTGNAPGIAAIEAAMLDTPVLSFQIDANYSAGQDDWIWSSADPGAIAERAEVLLKCPGEARSLSLRQQAHALEYHSADTMARSYERFYRATIEEQSRKKSRKA